MTSFIVSLFAFLLIWCRPFTAAAFEPPADPMLNGYAKEAAADQMPCLSASWPHEKSDLQPDPDLAFGRLENGFRYVLLENHEPKDRVSMHLVVLAGSLNESDDQQGLAHFLEHMMFNGSEHFPPGELVKFFQSIGMQFGGDANARTSFSETVYDMLLPSGSREDLEKGLLVMKDYASGALLLESEIDRERGIILSEKQAMDSAWYRTWISTTEFLYPDAKYSKRFTIGKEEVLKTADRALLKRYYDAWYRSENLILVAVGDFSTGILDSLIKNHFLSLSGRGETEKCPDIGQVNHKVDKTFYHFEKDAGNTEIAIQAAWRTMPQPDSLSYQKELLTRYVADSILRNRLDAMIRKPGCPFTSSSAYSGIFLNSLGYAKIYGTSTPEKWEETLESISHMLRQALIYGFFQAELNRVKKDIIAGLDSAVLEKKTRDSRQLAASIIDTLTDNKVFQSPGQEQDLYKPFIETLTVDEVNNAFKKIWDHGHRLILVTGNADITNRAQPPESEILNVYARSLQNQIARPSEYGEISFPYLDEPEKPGLIRNREVIADLGIEQVDFVNGVRLNLKKTDFKKNEVICSLCFGNGRKKEPAPGLAMVAESVLNQSGVGGLDKDELDRALAGRNTDVEFRVEEDTFLFSGTTVSKELPLLFQLLYARIADPAFREDAFGLTMSQFDQVYESLSRSVEGAMQLSGDRFLAGGDTRFGIPPYEEFKKITLGQIIAWIEPALHQDQIEISIAGDFNQSSAIDLAAKYFGSLPARTRLEDEKERIGFPQGGNLSVDVKTTSNKAMVVLTWPTEDFWDIFRTRRLSVLGEVFTEQMRNEIREKLGAAYSPYAYNDSSRTYEGYGVLKAVVMVDPEIIGKIVKEIEKISSDLAEKGVTEDEFRRTIDPIKTGIKDMLQTNQYWLRTVMENSVRYPVQLDWSRTIEKDYAAVTATDISQLAAAYLNNDKKAAIIIKPAGKEPHE